jgi:hypothetical protein
MQGVIPPIARGLQVLSQRHHHHHHHHHHFDEGHHRHRIANRSSGGSRFFVEAHKEEIKAAKSTKPLQL